MTDRLTNWFKEAMNESNKYYIDDIREEESASDEYETRLEEEMADAECETEEDFLEYLNSSYDDPIEWYYDNFGADDLGKACLIALGYRHWEDTRW